MELALANAKHSENETAPSWAKITGFLSDSDSLAFFNPNAQQMSAIANFYLGLVK